MNEVKKSNVEGSKGNVLQLARAFRELISWPVAPEAKIMLLVNSWHVAPEARIMLLEPLSRSAAFK